VNEPGPGGLFFGDILVARSTDNGATWTPPVPLDNKAAVDSRSDDVPQITTDGNGIWIAVWSSFGFSGSDFDILVSHSTDNGATWTASVALNTNAGSDTGNDEYPQIATDGQGHWAAVWQSDENLGGSIGTDNDIFVARSTDNGATWTPPAPLNNNAANDGNASDEDTHIATDGQGTWLAVWVAFKFSGNDDDILFARSLDNGATWTAPEALNTTAASDTGGDKDPRIATDRHGVWLAVWASDEGATGGPGLDNIPRPQHG
jgi:Neuraminidase (sialidase)